jgi:hypothetical protein
MGSCGLDSLESGRVQCRAFVSTATSLRVLGTSNRFRDRPVCWQQKHAPFCSRVTNMTAAPTPCAHAHNSNWTLCTYRVARFRLRSPCSKRKKNPSCLAERKSSRASNFDSPPCKPSAVSHCVQQEWNITVCGFYTLPWQDKCSFIYGSFNVTFKTTGWTSDKSWNDFRQLQQMWLPSVGHTDSRDHPTEP